MCLMTAVIIVIFVLAVVGVLFLIPVRLDVRYKKDAVQDQATVYLRFLWFKINLTDKKKKQNVQEKSTKKAGTFSGFKKKFQHYTKVFEASKDDLADILVYARDHALHVEKIDFQLDYGFEDPMYTGIAMGVISGASYNLLAFIMHWLAVDKHDIDIRPDFDKVCFSVNIWCIVHVKNVHIMVIATKILRLVRGLRKNNLTTERE